MNAQWLVSTDINNSVCKWKCDVDHFKVVRAGGADTCEQCDNAVCARNQYRTGTCRASDGTGFKCNNCAANCPIGQYRKGCSGSHLGECSACAAAKPANAEYSSQGSINTDDCQWQCSSSHYLNGGGSTCTACSNESCASGQYRSGSCSHADGNGWKCNACLENCPAGQYRSGCSGTSSGVCKACTNKPAGGFRYTTQGSRDGNDCGYVCSGTCESPDEEWQEDTCSCELRKVCPTGYTKRCGDDRSEDWPCSRVLSLDQSLESGCRCESNAAGCPSNYDEYCDRRSSHRRQLLGGRRRRAAPPPPPRDVYDCTTAAGYQFTNVSGCVCKEGCPPGQVEINCPRPPSDDDRRRRRQVLGKKHTRDDVVHLSTRADGVCCGTSTPYVWWDDDR